MRQSLSLLKTRGFIIIFIYLFLKEKGVGCSLWDMYDSFNGVADDTHTSDKISGHVTKVDGVVNTNASQIDQSLKFRGASAGVKSVGNSDSNLKLLQIKFFIKLLEKHFVLI